MTARTPLARSDSETLVQDREAGLERLLEIMRRLRDPDGGCPWDLEQDFRSIAPYTVEEAYEVAEAIESGDRAELCSELGDLLLQTVYHAQMAEEEGAFAFADVVRAVCDKMVRRHPHVFGAAAGHRTPEEQTADWERIKAAERGAKPARAPSALDGVAVTLPGLTRAVKLQNRAARVGFDWPDASHVLDKIVEEARELAEADTAADREEEYGDLMFVMANLGRHLGIDPEAALRRVNAKFERRFRGVEARLAAEGSSPAQSTLAEMDAHWDAIKAEEKAARAAAEDRA
ncbi:nucleoside triphosphate pyrophosphohydrolase [Paroceanicella profunda]|uniref:Nucleoside triphosphate pyrophosphohydrolase n=1 Tax=Paroceanicella profunda TaxID=2579971 RepID=A0A5B8FTQ3_9RHOB|nr:nucleoside triphosphate pyrophosphohydrolase [Paroceanicella profunda]QDL90684.1 nucleoside triphosphate pyrophosphohydrolase [Paroceanicella profunda]